MNSPVFARFRHLAALRFLPRVGLSGCYAQGLFTPPAGQTNQRRSD